MPLPLRRRFTPFFALFSFTRSSGVIIRRTSCKTIHTFDAPSESCTSSTMMIPMEKTYECSDGMTLATCHWFNSLHEKPNMLVPTTRRRILCLHGWLDNAASFYRFAPLLLKSSSVSSSNESETEIVALDFPGHGKSGHKSVDGPPQLLAEYAYYVAELINALQWDTSDDTDNDEGGRKTIAGVSRTAMDNIQRSSTNASSDDGNRNSSPTQLVKGTTNHPSNPPKHKIILVGHSMGAGVATILCAAFPEWFSSLILLEGGLVARNAQDAARHVRAACQRRLKSNRTLFPNPTIARAASSGDGGAEEEEERALDRLPPPSRAKVYCDVDAAVKARLSTAERMPGDQSLSYEAARELVLRATSPAMVDDTSSESVVFRHDPRLQWPSLQYYTREQVEAFYRDVHASLIPVCFLWAADGWPIESWAENLVKDVLKPVYQKKLRGSHHFHADPDSANAVAEHMLQFLVEQQL